ncbi:MAG TPA: prepilin-type N-terminal cleavage/methylation domain-containing protein [Candidatus Eremiobacteraceae bacterium]|nr:prepilin-type N-terminal cleavage/methylation domain-containing protein [Candidatus Eremiobacteraceae bacterium]
MCTRTKTRNRSKRQSGFTMIELMMATLVMLVGVVAVAQLIPYSLRLNTANRYDSTSLVIAQREMDQFVGQSISTATFTDAQNNNCNLGNPATPNVVVGNPVIFSAATNTPAIDFSGAQVAGYGFNSADVNDPSGATYDVRWAVVTYANGGNASAKRFIVGVQKRAGDAPLLPVTIDTMVQK